MPSLIVLENYSALRREIHLIFAQELKAFNFGAKQMMILFAVTERHTCTMGELAEVTMSDKATITRAVASLENDGLLKKVLDKTDSRKTLIQLTPKGRVQADRAQKIRENIGRKLTEALNLKEQEQLAQLLGKVVGGLKGQRTGNEI